MFLQNAHLVVPSRIVDDLGDSPKEALRLGADGQVVISQAHLQVDPNGLIKEFLLKGKDQYG